MIHSSIAVVRTAKHVGKCVYCGSIENLHDEHCIPESLNGVHVLEKGSCGDCGRITSQFEGRFARESMLPVRTAWNMKSKRSKKKRPKEFPMRFKKGGEERTINVPIEDHYSLIPLVELGPPGKYPLLPHANGLPSGQGKITPFRIRSDEHIAYLTKKYDADSISVDFQIDIPGFLRMIAKIAYCTMVFRYGLHNIAEAYVIPAILGKTNDIWDWVGSDGTQTHSEKTKHMNTDHLVTNWFSEDGQLLSAVKLFKKSPTPEYLVVVGRLREQTYAFYQGVGRK